MRTSYEFTSIEGQIEILKFESASIGKDRKTSELKDVLTNPNSNFHLRLYAAEKLINDYPEEALQVLHEALVSDDNMVQLNGASALVKIEPQKSLSIINDALNHEKQAIRKKAVDILFSKNPRRLAEEEVISMLQDIENDGGLADSVADATYKFLKKNFALYRN